MISRNIRNRVSALREMVDAGNLTMDKFLLALDGFESDAALVEEIEHRPVPAYLRGPVKTGAEVIMMRRAAPPSGGDTDPAGPGRAA